MEERLSNDEQIVASWHENATPWTTAINEAQIESRRLVTDDAIVETVLSCQPQSILDLGCGEGWLSRKFSEQEIDVLGVDVVPELIESAHSAGGGKYQVCSYEAIAAGALKASVDVVVCNFSLLGKESVEGVVQASSQLLNKNGSLIVQTLHPLIACGDALYQDGWREGSWDGFSSEFTNPAPWFFRTLESWTRLFRDSGFHLHELREPVHPSSGKPVSLIFVLKPK